MIKPRIVLCILHDQPNKIKNICNAYPSFHFDEDYSDCGKDENMQNAFEYSWERVLASETEEDVKAVSEHQNVAYVVSVPMEQNNSLEVAKNGLELIAEVFEIGARAVKCESSGIAHGKSKWNEFSNNPTIENIYLALVRRPLGSDQTMYSCGMHLLGMRDIKLQGFSDWESVRVIDAFAKYLFESDREEVKSGSTFQFPDGENKIAIELVNCEGYEEDDFFYNPYGYYQLKT